MSQTKAQLIDPVDGTIVNADINANAAIDVSKLSGVLPLAGGTLVGNLSITREQPVISFNDSTDNPDYYIGNIDGSFRINDTTNSVFRLVINSSGNVGIATTSPAQKFHVYGNSGTTAIALGDNSTTEPYMLLEANETDNLCTVHSRTNNPLTFKIANAEKARFDASGRLGIGTSSPSELLHIKSNSADCAVQIESTGSGTDARLRLFGRSNGVSQIQFGDENDANVGLLTYDHTTNSMQFRTTDAERVRIDSTGKLLVGIQTARANFGNNTSGVAQKIQLEGTTATTSSMSLIRNSNDANDGGIIVGKTRGTSVGANTVVQSGDDLGNITFAGSDGTSMLFGAEIKATVESGVGNDDMPAALKFSTNGGSTNIVERMVIDSSGKVIVKTNGLKLENATATNSRTFSITNAAGTTGWSFGNGVIASAHQFVIYDNSAGAGRLLIDSNGIARFNNGIQLGNGLTNSTAHQLDDYEEGTFTPAFSNGLVFSSYATNGQRGVYTKIGRFVYGTIRLDGSIASTQNTNQIRISGLPFASANFSNGEQVGGADPFFQDGFYNANDFAGIVNNNSSVIQLVRRSDGASLTGTSVNAGRQIRVSFWYMTA